MDTTPIPIDSDDSCKSYASPTNAMSLMTIFLVECTEVLFYTKGIGSRMDSICSSQEKLMANSLDVDRKLTSIGDNVSAKVVDGVLELTRRKKTRIHIPRSTNPFLPTNFPTSETKSKSYYKKHPCIQKLEEIIASAKTLLNADDESLNVVLKHC